MLFTGFMLTPSGPKVLEYNVRFGDPETESLMLLLGEDVDFAALLLVRITFFTSLRISIDQLIRLVLNIGWTLYRYPSEMVLL